MNITLDTLAIAAIALAAIACGPAAQAQATLDQSKALAGGVTAEDTPGFPITLSRPGSYKLTGNLVVPANLGGVHITVPGVTLDLNGFNITGPGTCLRNDATFAVTCSFMPTVTHGVLMTTGGSTLRNGNVRGFYTGVFFFGADQIENLLVEHNHGYGLANGNTDGARSLIRHVRSQLNGGGGFNIGDSLVQGSTAASNGLDGFGSFGSGRNVVLDSVAFANKGTGFKGKNMAIGRSVAQQNKVADIFSATSLGGNLNGSVLF